MAKEESSASRNNFNSIKVRLELLRLVQAVTMLRYFNSIKVRLELSGSQKKAYVLTKFQFHKGTIRTSLPIRFPLLALISIP